VIALHSPNAFPESGLRTCPPEKVRQIDAIDPEQSILSSPLCGRNITKYGHVLRISRQKAEQFLGSLDLLAEQAVWR
jgi:hypothetical protein